MSIRSYKRNRALGVTGANTPTCFPSALEQVARHGSFDPDAYEYYTQYINEIDELTGQGKRKMNPWFKEVCDALAANLMGFTFEDFWFYRAHTAEDFTDTVRTTLDEGYGVVIDLAWEADPAFDGEIMHSVGLHAIKGTPDFLLRSNWVPVHLQGPISLEALFPHIAQSKYPPRETYPFNDTNITALPI
jgi:hypothetical protein